MKNKSSATMQLSNQHSKLRASSGVKTRLNWKLWQKETEKTEHHEPKERKIISEYGGKKKDKRDEETTTET